MPKLIMHRNFQVPKDELTRAIEGAEPGQLIFQIGPAGVGKTTMRHAVLRAIFGSPEHWGPGRVPAIEVMALLQNQAYFTSFGLVDSLLGELFAPDLHWLLDGGPESPSVLRIVSEVAKSRKIWETHPRKTQPERKAWEQFGQLATSRSMHLASIDQAAALCTNHKNTSPADHILNLMSIAEKYRLNILLSGVHKIAQLWSTRSEIRRRSIIVWVPPYSYTRPMDRDPFLQLLRTLGSRYQFSKPRLLYDMSADILAASAGIYGIVEKLFKDASIKAESAGRSEIRKLDIEASVYGDTDLRQLWEDVHAFEEARKVGATKTQASIVVAKWNLRNPRLGKSQKCDGAVRANDEPQGTVT